MGDYLSNLVSKSLGRSGEVRPRGLSLYEPLPGTATLAIDLGGGGEVQAEGEWPEPEPAPRAAAYGPAASTLPRGRDAGSVPRLEAARPAGRRPESAAQATSPGPQPAIAATAADIAPRLQPGFVPGDREPAPPPAAGERKAEGRPAVEPLIRERIVERIVIAEPGDRGDGGDPAAPGSPPPLSDRRRPPGPAGEPKPAPPAAPVVVQPQVRAAPPRPTVVPPVLRPASAETAPTVHVTIGRIEVRATLPEAAARRPRQVPPVMSLEEYLKQHTRGGSG